MGFVTLITLMLMVSLCLGNTTIEVTTAEMIDGSFSSLTTPQTPPFSSSTEAQTTQGFSTTQMTKARATPLNYTIQIPETTSSAISYPDNSYIIEKLLQVFGEEFLKFLGSLSLKCAINEFISEYREILSRGCRTETLQNISNIIKEACADEQMTCSLSRKRSDWNGIEVCVDSTVKTSPCPEALVSDQKFCDDFYIFTLNCSILQPKETTTMTSSTTQTILIQEISKDVQATRYAGAALGGFVAGTIMTSLIVYFLYKHQQRKNKANGSLSNTHFPNLNRPLPRIESDVYNKIDEINEMNHNDGTQQTNGRYRYDLEFTVERPKENPAAIAVGNGGMKKSESSAKGFYTFDPRRSIDEGIVVDGTKYGKLSPMIPRNNSSSWKLDNMGYLSPSKISKMATKNGATALDKTKNVIPDEETSDEDLANDSQGETGIINEAFVDDTDESKSVVFDRNASAAKYAKVVRNIETELHVLPNDNATTHRTNDISKVETDPIHKSSMEDVNQRDERNDERLKEVDTPEVTNQV